MQKEAKIRTTNGNSRKYINVDPASRSPKYLDHMHFKCTLSAISTLFHHKGSMRKKLLYIQEAKDALNFAGLLALHF